jgi:sugar phosphate isomerase/epimerase
MQFGFMTNILVKQGMTSLSALAQWAEANGFTDMEVGPTVPLYEEEFDKVIHSGKVNITSLTYCRNFLSSNEGEASSHIAELKRRIEFASRLGIGKIVTSTGIDKRIEEGIYDKADSIRKTPLRSMDAFLQTFGPIVELAEKKNVKLAFENCPLMGNIAISPYMWRELFSHLQSDYVGLTYDPSHLVWQGIDPIEPLFEFSNKIFHVHAKDTVVDRKILKDRGILTDFSWWHYTIPGQGEIDWKAFFSALSAIGYQGTVSIEHEDDKYAGSLEQVEKGIVLSRTYLDEILREEN